MSVPGERSGRRIHRLEDADRWSSAGEARVKRQVKRGDSIDSGHRGAMHWCADRAEDTARGGAIRRAADKFRRRKK